MPGPDKDGLFDFAGVKAIALRRDCKVKKLSDLALQVTGAASRLIEICAYDRKESGRRVKKDSGATLTAIAPGLWDPVSIIAACTKARGLTVYEVDRATAKPMNPYRLDEIKIARICGADSLRPYLTKKSNYALFGVNGRDVADPGQAGIARGFN